MCSLVHSWFLTPGHRLMTPLYVFSPCSHFHVLLLYWYKLALFERGTILSEACHNIAWEVVVYHHYMHRR
jgi:hypothetical protein